MARAKAELVEALQSDGTAVLNADDPRVRAMAERTTADVLLVGESGDADVRVEQIHLDDLARATFRIHTPWGADEVRLAVSGRHMAIDAALAVAAAGLCDVPLYDAVTALAGDRGVPRPDGGAPPGERRDPDRRRLQRQPGVDAGRRSTPSPRSTPAGASRCWA